MTIDTTKTYTPEELADVLLSAMKTQLEPLTRGPEFFENYRNTFISELRGHFGESICDTDVDPEVMLTFFSDVCQTRDAWLAFNLAYTETEVIQWTTAEFYGQVYESTKELVMGENGLINEGDLSEEVLHRYVRKYFDTFGRGELFLSVSLVFVPMLVMHDLFKMTFFNHLDPKQALELINE